MILFSVLRKRRGIYLTHIWFTETGEEDHDVFTTAAEAKREMAASMDRKRLPWVEEGPGRWSCQMQEQEEDDE